jgi:hypothetical protein
MRRLEFLLGFDRSYLIDLASHAGAHYLPFRKVDRPRPFPRKLTTAKLRVIDNPQEELKTVQARINDRLLRPLRLPPNVLGGVTGKSVLDNAALHRYSRTLVKADVARFFPSITNRHVYTVWRHLLGFSPRIAGLLTRLTTFERHLPQGAPTSTSLANLVLYSIDQPVRKECERLGIEYSSWIDDLAFSADDPRPIIQVLITTLRKGGLRLSRKKLIISGPGDRKVLNGVLLSAHGLSVQASRLANIRSGIHKLKQGLVPISEIEGYVRSLRGGISHVASIHPKKAVRLRRELEPFIHKP